MEETTSENTKQDVMKTSFETVEEKMVLETNQNNVTDDNLEGGFTADAEHKEKRQLPVPKDLTYKQIFLTKGNDSLGYKYPLYHRCELRENFHSLTYFDGTSVERLAVDTVFRPGQEVFLCPVQRTKAIGKIFVLVGIMPTNVKIPPLCIAVLLDKAAYELSKGIEEFEKLVIFRTCPIKHIGRVPGGGTFEDTQSILVESEPVLRKFFDDLKISGKELSSFDFVQQCTKIKNSYNSPSKLHVESKPQTRGSSRDDKKIPLQNSHEVAIVTTPPFARRISSQLSGISQSLAKMQKNEAPKSCKDKQNATISGKLQEMTKERDSLKKFIKSLQKENSNLLLQISAFTTTNAELTTKNAAQAAELASFKSSNYGGHSAVQMPFQPCYPGIFPPPMHIPLTSQQQQQGFPYSFPALNSASAQTPPATGPEHMPVSNRQHAQKLKSRSKRSRSKEYDSNFKKKRRNTRYQSDEYDSESH